MRRTATDVPHLRRRLVEYGVDLGPLGMQHGFEVALQMGVQKIKPAGVSLTRQAQILTGYETERLRKAGLFFCEEEMCDLLAAVYPTMPGFNPAPHDLPSEHGFIVFQKPIVQFLDECGTLVVPTSTGEDIEVGQVQIVAASWGPFNSGGWAPFNGMTPGGGIWFSFWARSNAWEQRLKEPGLAAAAPIIIEDEAAHTWPSPDTPEGTYLLDPANLIKDGTGHWMRMIYCAFLLSRQAGIAETVEQNIERHERKRGAKVGIDGDRPIRVVRLRQGSLRPTLEPAEESGTRVYRHRWVVRPFWRKQWYPSAGVHRPRLVAGHMKGPADAPFLPPKETVRIL